MITSEPDRVIGHCNPLLTLSYYILSRYFSSGNAELVRGVHIPSTAIGECKLQEGATRTYLCKWLSLFILRQMQLASYPKYTVMLCLIWTIRTLIGGFLMTQHKFYSKDGIQSFCGHLY